MTGEDPRQAEWEPASYNVQGEDGQMYGRWRRVLRRDPHGLTVVSRYTAPPGKAWKVVGKAPPLGEDVLSSMGIITIRAAERPRGRGRICSMRRGRSMAGFRAT